MKKGSFGEFGSVSIIILAKLLPRFTPETAKNFSRHLYEIKGEFLEQVHRQYYDEEANQFFADRYWGTCPKCGE